jgi:hypothetical protein
VVLRLKIQAEGEAVELLGSRADLPLISSSLYISLLLGTSNNSVPSTAGLTAGFERRRSSLPREERTPRKPGTAKPSLRRSL